MLSDLLEAPPSALKDTSKAIAPTNLVPPKKAKAPAAFETKKQRQNRKKAELKKAAREEEEKKGKVALELKQYIQQTKV
jgi:hypothetical protein